MSLCSTYTTLHPLKKQRMDKAIMKNMVGKALGIGLKVEESDAAGYEFKVSVKKQQGGVDMVCESYVKFDEDNNVVMSDMRCQRVLFRTQYSNIYELHR
jgi:hypothetical protein